MKKISIDKKDLSILSELDKNPNLNLNSLAKNVGISRQVALYRLNKLKSQKTIYSFYTLINITKLGYLLFRVHIRLKNVSRKEYEEFSKRLFEETPSYWVAFMSGSFDVIYDVFAKNPIEFQKLITKVVGENKDIVQSYESFIILEMNLYQYGFKIKNPADKPKVTYFNSLENIKIDGIDKKILQLIQLDSRLPYETVGKKVGLTRNAVKNRIKNLEKSGVIAGYKIFIDFSQLGRYSYKVFLRYNNRKLEQEKDLINFINSSNGLLAIMKLFGRWNLDIEIQKENVKELQEFIMELRKFEIVEDHEIVQIIDELGFYGYPTTLD